MLRKVLLGISCLMFISCAAPDYKERKKIVIRPVKREKEDEKRVVKLTLGESTNFAFDKAKVRDEDKRKLDEFIDSIEGLKGTLIIIGHTDTRGSYKYNDRLSLKRAISVRDYMAARLDLSNYIVDVSGRGEYDNLVEEKEKSDWAKNRRVEVTFISES